MSEQEAVPFDSLVDPKFSQLLYSKFMDYINERQSEPFSNIVKKDLFVGLDKENILKVFSNAEISTDEEDIVQFLTANAYCVAPPKYYKQGHIFTPMQKTHIVGYGFFIDGINNDKDYEYTSPEQQTNELLDGQVSEKFIEFGFTPNIEGLVLDYNEYLKENNL